MRNNPWTVYGNQKKATLKDRQKYEVTIEKEEASY